MRPTFEIADGAWEITSAGALRCRARVLAVGVMDYRDEELGELADGSGQGGMLVTLDSLSEPRALRSLEGAPVVSDQHTWITEPGAQAALIVGHVAGTPSVEAPYLYADLVITDKAAIDKIKTRQLSEVSAAYDAEGAAERGQYDGRAYVGRQQQLRYNHVALLPAGAARGGPDVRILNTQPVKKEAVMADPIRVRLRNGKTIHVLNEDDAQAVQTLDGQAEQAKLDGDKVQSLMAELDTLKSAKKEVDAQHARVTGELQTIKEQLEAALAPAAVETAAQAIVNQRAQALQVLNADSLPEELKTLSGHPLRVAVVSRVRGQNGWPALTPEQVADEHFVEGVYEGLRQRSPVKPVINGSSLTQPSTGQKPHAMGLTDNRQRFDTLYGGQTP